MLIRSGMEEKYHAWLKKLDENPKGKRISEIFSEIAKELEKGVSGKEVFEKYLRSGIPGLTLEDRTKIALAVSVLHMNGGDVRFAWNSYHRGEKWAMGIELLKENRIHNPC